MRHSLVTAAALLALANAPALAQSANSPADPNAGNAMPQPSNSLPPGSATNGDTAPDGSGTPKPRHHHHAHHHHAAKPATPDAQSSTPPGQMAAPSVENQRDATPPASPPH